MSGEGTPWDREQYLSHGEDWWPPHEVRMELVEGCALRCQHCGIQGIREPGDRTLRFMDPALPVKAAREIYRRIWKSVLVYTGRGEMCNHPNLDRIVEEVRDLSRLRWQTQVLETSGAGLLDLRLRNHGPIGIRYVNRMASLMESGLTVLMLHRRRGTEYIWDAVDDMAEDAAYLLDARLERYYVSHTSGRADRVFCLIRDVVRAKMADPVIRASAHAGAGARAFRPHVKRVMGVPMCGRPAQELVVRFDGRVVICQEDYRGEVCIGDFNEQSLYDIWYSPIARSARARGFAGLRDLRPCSGCDHVTDGRMLVGCRHMVRPPDSGDLVRLALEQPPLTTPVLRHWERPGAIAPRTVRRVY